MRTAAKLRSTKAASRACGREASRFSSLAHGNLYRAHTPRFRSKKETNHMKKDTKTTAKEVLNKAETAVKTTAAKAETAAKTTAAKAETAAKKTAAKAETAAKKATAKKPAAKKPAAKKAPVINAVLQFNGKECSVAELAEQAKAGWTGGEVKQINLYIKPEDSRVYVVINGEVAESIEL